MKPAPPVTRIVRAFSVRVILDWCCRPYRQQLTLPYVRHTFQHRARLRAAVHDQIDRGHVRNELAVKLWIDGMGEILPFDRDPVALEQRDVQVVPRRTAA